MNTTPQDILKKYWNYSHFRGIQESIIQAVLHKKNSVILLPTGGGKSLCFQVPALLLDGVCIVISPLIALIQDQVNGLLDKNIKAIALTSQLSQDEIITAFDNLKFGNYKFLYLSPEKLQSTFIQEKIKELNVSIVAIDEAHCISEWGHDFRPSYLQLNILKELQPNAVFMALTATATERVLTDIQQNLELDNAQVFKQSFKRTNLNYRVVKTEDIYGKLLQLLSKVKGASIIYVNTRKQTKNIAVFLQKQNFKCSFYHGGLSTQEKNKAYQNWMLDETPVMVATNAFGMGIDKSNVRAVFHLNTPGSLENYIQESGRAGRDEKKSYAIILTNPTNIFEAEQLFINNLASSDFVKKVYHLLNQYFTVALGELPLNSFNFLLQEFCLTYQLNLLQTYNALKILERENILLIDDNYSKKSTLKFIINNKQIFEYLESYPSKRDLIQLILRSYGGIFDHYTIINEYKLSKKLKTSKKEIITSLKDLLKDGIVDYNYENTASKLTFLVTRDQGYTMNMISKNISRQNNLKFEKLKASIQYIQNDKVCRNIQLLSYFNEELTEPCGTCDVCMAKTQPKNNESDTISEIIKQLKLSELNSQELVSIMNIPDTEILNSLKILLEQGKITITSQNKFKLNFK